MTRQAEDHLHAFLRALTEAGVSVSPPKRADFLMSVVASPPEHIRGLYWRARLTLVTDKEAYPAFDAVFDAFFRGSPLLLEEPAPDQPDEAGETASPKGHDDGELEPLEPVPGSGLHASPVELRRTRSFAATSPAARAQLQELGSTLGEVLPAIAARRPRAARRGRRPRALRH